MGIQFESRAMQVISIDISSTLTFCTRHACIQYIRVQEIGGPCRISLMLRMIKMKTFGENGYQSYDLYREKYFRLVIITKPLKDPKRVTHIT